MLIPNKYSNTLEERIHPWVAYIVLPLFAFSALAVEINITIVQVVSSVVGIAILFRVIGKAIGITLGAWLGSLLVRRSVEKTLSISDYARISVLGGIGFTVAFLVNDIVFANNEVEHSQALVASLLAAVLASLIAALVFRLRNRS
jgi:NhaA family Na+:H+ antiporter